MKDEQGFDPDLNYTAVDNPFWDCTDAAHPAWWRGHDWAVASIKQRFDLVPKKKAETPKESRPESESICYYSKCMGECSSCEVVTDDEETTWFKTWESQVPPT